MITKEQFEDYEAVRESGVTNMFAWRTVSEISGLTKEEIMEIIKTYEILCNQYPSVRKA